MCKSSWDCTCKHSPHLARVIKTSFVELGNDANLISVVRHRHAVNEAPTQPRGVESVEDVLVRNVVEQHHLQ